MLVILAVSYACVDCSHDKLYQSFPFDLNTASNHKLGNGNISGFSHLSLKSSADVDKAVVE